jgi:uncharacterized Fe-S center protein
LILKYVSAVENALPFCQFDAVKIAWDEDTANLQKKVAEYCLAILEEKKQKAAFFNFLTHITNIVIVWTNLLNLIFLISA